MPERDFPDEVALLVDALVVHVDHNDTRTGAETPGDFTGRLPFIRARRGGGPSGQLEDQPTVDIDVFTTTYAEGIALAKAIRRWLMPPGRKPPIRWFDRVTCPSGPQELPWGDGVVRRFGATYEVVTRRRPMSA